MDLPTEVAKGLPGRLRRATGYMRSLLAWAVLGIGVYVAATTVWMTFASWSAVPINDQWDQLASVRNVSWSWLISQQNEHRMLVPRLVFLMDAWLFGETNVLTFVGNIIVQGTLCFLLVFIATGKQLLRSQQANFVTGVSLALLFWAVQFENFSSGLGIAFFLVLLFSALAFATAALLRPTLLTTVLVLILEGAATYTNANGIIASFLMIPLAILVGRPGRQVLVFVFFAIGLLGSFLDGYHTPSYHSDPTTALHTILPIAGHTLAQLGAPFGTAVQDIVGVNPTKIAIGLGCFGSVYIGTVIWQLVCRPGGARPPELVLLAIACFAFGTTLLIAVGRAERFGITQAFSSRYATIALVFWCSLFLITTRLYFGTDRRLYFSTDLRPVVIMVAGFAALILVFLSQPIFVAVGVSWANQRRIAIPALLSGTNDLALLENLYPPAPARLLEIRDLLRKAHASVFHDEWGYWLGTPMKGHVTPLDGGGCEGGFELAQAVTQTGALGWRAYGHAQVLGRPVDKIIFVASNGQIIGFGVNDTTPQISHGVARHDAWVGSFMADDGAMVHAYGLIDHGRFACSLGLPQYVAKLSLEVLPNAPTPVSTGGYVETIEIGQHTLITGWAMLSAAGSGQRVVIDTNLKVQSGEVVVSPRPDVAAALKDDALNYSGIRVALDVNPVTHMSLPAKLCVVTSDPKYGTRLLQNISHPELCPAP